MFNSPAFFIGLRYTRAKRRNHFISFISMVSMISIALGVMVLITVLSVMNGFDREIKKRVFSMVPPITISTVNGSLSGWEGVQHLLKDFPFITASAPFISGQVLLNYGGMVKPSMLIGILPEEESKVFELAQQMVQGKLTDLQSRRFGIILGDDLAKHLGAKIGDKITVISPQVTVSLAGVIPRYKLLTVVGIFHAGNGFGFDAGLGFIHLNDAQKLYGLHNDVTGLHLRVQDVYAAPRLAVELATQLSPSASITTWADQFGEFFHAVKLEKTMMFFILLLMIAVAAFNLVSTLMMAVNEKASDIAILRTMGAAPGMIMRVFMIQGGIIGLLGTALGVASGIALASNVTEIVNAIEAVFHVQLLSSNVYFVDYLPSYIEWSDVITVGCASLFLSLLATLYPAWRAAKMDPVESLRYE